MTTDKLISFLRTADPAQVDEARVMRLQASLMAQLDAHPQEDCDQTSVGFFIAPSLVTFSRGLALGILVLVMGLWVGQQSGVHSANKIAQQSMVQQVLANRAGSAVKAQDEVSVTAMATPWEDWVEEGE